MTIEKKQHGAGREMAGTLEQGQRQQDEKEEIDRLVPWLGGERGFQQTYDRRHASSSSLLVVVLFSK
jgi:hypothetical protein